MVVPPIDTFLVMLVLGQKYPLPPHLLCSSPIYDLVDSKLNVLLFFPKCSVRLPVRCNIYIFFLSRIRVLTSSQFCTTGMRPHHGLDHLIMTVTKISFWMTFSPIDVPEDGNRISQQVYVNACKHLHVTPGKKILRSLTSAQVSAKERIGNKREVETIAYALTVSRPKISYK